MSQPKVTVVIPTLTVGPSLLECLASLAKQSRRDFDVIIVDNSGKGLVRQSEAGRLGATVLEAVENLGFGAALNEGIRNSQAPYIATLNDDAIAHPGWLAALIEAIEARQDVGSCASQVRLLGQDRLDSAGMLIAADGSSKQRGHGESPSKFPKLEEVLCPSGSAAIYRRKMVERVGLFDGDFFLYCEDTDLGLRAQWAGWKCLYVPEAVAEHEYSRTAGNASPLKAYYVERNRLMLAAKNFPVPELLKLPASTLARYFWHSFEAITGHGSAGRFQSSGGGGVLQMGYIAARAHLAAAWHLRRLWKKRRQIRYDARITPEQFRQVLRKYSITPRGVAAQ
ncbi:MAG TPA: glycosyltransferase family 2 protein [Bryobacteraceae bacterium]|nr:glycosyltransferase family 2 protein [Bryobacteraceae bacterium]